MLRSRVALSWPHFGGKDAAMKPNLPHLLWLVLLAPLALGQARALPKNPPLPPPRPAFPQDAPPQDPAPQRDAALSAAEAPAPPPPAAVTPEAIGEQDPPGFALAEKAGLADLTRQYARRHGVPLLLLDRIIMRESRYRPRLVHRRFYGLMQITPGTARGMGFHGAPKSLLDAETNLTYATPYLANAWILADGDIERAVRYYSSGYYYTAKKRHMLDQMRNANSPPVTPPSSVATETPPPPPEPKGFLDSVFGGSGQ
jgi:soluble lytic murein transglycosylase-like protein